jgi:hypothetical protein
MLMSWVQTKHCSTRNKDFNFVTPSLQGVLIYFGLTNTCVLAGFNWMPRACFLAFNLR